jgi:hypothetical protein
MLKPDSPKIPYVTEIQSNHCIIDVLYHSAIYIHHHAIGPGDNQWPKGPIALRIRDLVSIMLSFGDVQLDIFTPNIENLTMNLEGVAELDSIEGLSTTMHFIFSQMFTAMLELGDTKQSEVHWISTGLEELRNACQAKKLPSAMSVSDIDKIAFPHDALATNQRYAYRQRELNLPVDILQVGAYDGKRHGAHGAIGTSTYRIWLAT